jgi:hypothetical protein
MYLLFRNSLIEMDDPFYSRYQASIKGGLSREKSPPFLKRLRFFLQVQEVMFVDPA